MFDPELLLRFLKTEDKCQHNGIDMGNAIFNGVCPICLQEENADLRSIIDGSAGEVISTILKDNNSPDEIKNLFIEHPIFGLFTLEMADWFAAAGGKNYVEVLIGFTLETKDFVMTIQKKAGKTPHELRQELEAENARLNEALRHYVDARRVTSWGMEEDEDNGIIARQALGLQEPQPPEVEP